MEQNEQLLSYDERRRRALVIQRERREAQVRRNLRIIAGILITAVTTAAATGIYMTATKDSVKRSSRQKAAAVHVPQTESQQQVKASSILDQADTLAAMYDYDAAISLLQEQSDYSSDTEMQQRAAQYQSTKESCISWPIEEVTHVFYHTLIADPARAFDGDSKEGGYNQVMTTVDEFNKITQIMYEKGFVLVSLKDMATVVTDEAGNRTMQKGEILLPPGKQPFVLSQDDVSYYHYMDGDGCARKLIIDENGDIKNEYVQADGKVVIGDYDMVPLIDRYVEKHPGFSYRGAKGILALTG